MENNFNFGLDFADLVDEMFNVKDVPPVIFPAFPVVDSNVPVHVLPVDSDVPVHGVPVFDSSDVPVHNVPILFFTFWFDRG